MCRLLRGVIYWLFGRGMGTKKRLKIEALYV